MLSLRRFLAAACAVLLLATSVPATWSIIIINRRTGEIAIGCATCLTRIDLAGFVPVMAVGKGAGCAQSAIDSSGMNRATIWSGLQQGLHPDQILATLAMNDPAHQSRQYGIVRIDGAARGFTGSQAGAWAGHWTGEMGELFYALQGNVLTGQPVLTAAEVAIWTTPGTLADKLMAAMEAAAFYGGDGRCSCTSGPPTACGAPPASFTKASHVGFMMISRLGDVDGSCSGGGGCANGRYYLNLNIRNQSGASPDPVLQLRQRFDAWAATQVGRPDHVLSTTEFPTTLPADGTTIGRLRITLRDRTGAQLTSGGATITTALDPSSTGTATVGTPIDNGDGTYDVPVTAGTQAGSIRLVTTVNDGSGPRQLAPANESELLATRLWFNRTEISARDGADLRFVINAPTPLGSNRVYALLGSASGTFPGIFLPPFVILSLVPDPFFFAMFQAGVQNTIPDLLAVTDANGRAEGSLPLPRGLYTIPPGTELNFAWVTVSPFDLASPSWAIRVVQ